MKIPEPVYQRQSGLTIFVGVIFIIIGLIMFSQGYAGILMGIVTLLFSVCLISLGSRKVIDHQMFTDWLASQIYNQVEKTNYVIPKEELKIDVLYDIFKYQTKEDKGLEEFSEYLRFNPQFESIIGQLISEHILVHGPKGFYIPKEKIDYVKELFD